MYRCGWYAHRWSWRRGRAAAMAWDPKAFEDEAVRRRSGVSSSSGRQPMARRRAMHNCDERGSLMPSFR
jgi:hypothetical protein